MATYKRIIGRVKAICGKTMKTCWIADVKAKHELTGGPAPNRLTSAFVSNPCPAAYRATIEQALREFGMIPGAISVRR